MTKRFAILIVTAVSAAVLASSALAKATVLLPGGSYLNQASSTGLSCLTGSAGASGTTTFIVTVQQNQGGQAANFKVDYTFDPDDPALASFSGNANFHVEAPSGSGVIQTVPVSIPVSSDDGLVAQVANSSVISIGSDGTLYYDSSNLSAWACDTPAAQGGGGSGGGGSAGNCTAAYPLMIKLGLEVYFSNARPELLKKIVESGRECLKGHVKEAAHKMDEFVKELSKQAKNPLTPAQVAQFTDEAIAIKATLLG